MTDHLHTDNMPADELIPGNERSFTAFYKAYAEKFFYYCTRYITDDDEAKIIVDEKFVTMWEMRANFKTMSDMRAYMYVSLRNACYEHLRHSREENKRDHLHITEPAIAESVDHQIVRTELMKALYDRIQQLAPQKKEVMELLYFQDMTIAEAARQMGISEEAVRQNKHRALTELRSKAIGDKLLLLFLLLLK